MKVAVVGSRGLMPSDEEMAEHLSGAGEIVSGGAAGVDTCAAAYAARHGLTLTEFLPDYARYGRAAPIVRNREIVDHADRVVVFWDGSSKGALSVIRYAEKVGKPCTVVRPAEDDR